MDPVTLLSAVAFPLLLLFGGIAAWQMSKNRNHEESRPENRWRDDSLDEWRRERDAEIERERAERMNRRAEQHPGSTEEQEETVRHQRIGG
jgi:hypothetical protein